MYFFLNVVSIFLCTFHVHERCSIFFSSDMASLKEPLTKQKGPHDT
jgi:hypothetical protein